MIIKDPSGAEETFVGRSILYWDTVISRGRVYSKSQEDGRSSNRNWTAESLPGGWPSPYREDDSLPIRKIPASFPERWPSSYPEDGRLPIRTIAESSHRRWPSLYPYS